MSGELIKALNSRDRVLGLLRGENVDRIACYSGMGSFCSEGLRQLGYSFWDVHVNSQLMAELAASSYRLFKYESAIVPLDVCVEAESLGSEINFYVGAERLIYPSVKGRIIKYKEDLDTLVVPANLAERGRIPVVLDALKLAKRSVGTEVAVGSYLLGPFTLAGQIMELSELLKLSYRDPGRVGELLLVLTEVVISIAKAYELAGADFLTIREMGATTDIINPEFFREYISPQLKKIFASISCPKVLHICGSSARIVEAMVEAGADAISVDEKNNLSKSRAMVGKTPLLFGNVDGHRLLLHGTPNDVQDTVLRCIEDGVDGVWPGCDIWPDAPLANLRAMVETVENYGGVKWVRKS